MSNRPKTTNFNLDKRKITLLLFSVFCFGIYHSRFFLALIPYLVLIYGFTLKDTKARFQSFLHDKAFFSVALIFFIYLFSGINSQNSHMWISRLNTNLIYLVIPLGIYMIGPFSRKMVNTIIAIFTLTNVLMSIVILLGYLMNIENINKGYLSGNIIETPIPYVRYSYFVAVSIVFSLYLYYIKFYIIKEWEKYIYLFSTVFLLVFLHVLAVRTGILSLYITIFVVGFIYMMKYKKYKVSIIGLIFMVSVIVLSYLYLPTVQNKIRYVKWDIENAFEQDNPYNTSDRIRIYSIINGLKLMQDNPAFGVGIGDIESEMDKKYQINYPTLPKELRFEPINQYVFILASFGLIGFLMFFGLLLVPLFTKNVHPLLLPFYILTFSSFIGETTIELIIGKSAFLFLLSILMFRSNNIES